MRRTLIIGILAMGVFTMISCGGASWSSYQGELLGQRNRPNWNVYQPYGMVYIPTGVFHAGQSYMDVNNSNWQKPKAMSMKGFFMDETEITNNEYRQFINWVRDSIAHRLLDHVDGNSQSNPPRLDWNIEIPWEEEMADDASVLSTGLFYDKDDRLWGNKTIDPGKLVYVHEWYDYKTAANKNAKILKRKELIKREQVLVYPDTLVWIRDFTYSYNEPWARQYFHHPAFDDYPVVGVSWPQASAFTTWRTKFLNDDRRYAGLNTVDQFRLPTEFEWEYAARGGRDMVPYPWGGPYVRNAKGCILANFKPGRGNYPEDGGLYTVRADAYWPNDWGLYNMAGNVAEWTSTAFSENLNPFVHDLNGDYKYDAAPSDNETQKRKVIRGGSWKDVAYFIQTGTRHWEYQDTTSSHTGFRCVLPILGRTLKD